MKFTATTALALLLTPFFSPAFASPEGGCEDGSCWLGCGETSPAIEFVTASITTGTRYTEDGLILPPSDLWFATDDWMNGPARAQLRQAGWSCENCEIAFACRLDFEIVSENTFSFSSWDGLTLWTTSVWDATVNPMCTSCYE